MLDAQQLLDVRFLGVRDLVRFDTNGRTMMGITPVDLA